MSVVLFTFMVGLAVVMLIAAVFPRLERRVDEALTYDPPTVDLIPLDDIEFEWPS